MSRLVKIKVMLLSKTPEMLKQIPLIYHCILNLFFLFLKVKVSFKNKIRGNYFEDYKRKIDYLDQFFILELCERAAFHIFQFVLSS